MASTNAPASTSSAPARTPPVPAPIRDATPAGTTREEPFRVGVRRPGNGVVVVHASGTLDTATEPRFAEPVRHRLSCTASRLVLDLSEVTFLDTAGAVCLLEAATRAAMREMTLVLVAGPPVHHVLELMGVTDRFCYAEDAEEAGRIAVEAAPWVAPLAPVPAPDGHVTRSIRFAGVTEPTSG